MNRLGLVLLLSLALVLLSAFLSPETNWTVRALVAGFLALAVVAPPAALLITLALPGFGTILGHMAGVPTLAGPVLSRMRARGRGLHEREDCRRPMAIEL